MRSFIVYTLRELCVSPVIMYCYIKEMKVVRMCCASGDVLDSYATAFRSEGKIPLGGPRRRWKNNIKVGVKEADCMKVHWIQLV
jgi:hypothetical protein